MTTASVKTNIPLSNDSASPSDGRKAKKPLNSAQELPSDPSEPSSSERAARCLVSPAVELPPRSLEPVSVGGEARQELAPIEEMPRTPADLIDRIRIGHRKRDMEMRSHGNIVRQLRSFCRSMIGGTFHDDKKEGERRMKLADAVYDALIAGQWQDVDFVPSDEAEQVAVNVGYAAVGIIAGLKHFESCRRDTEKYLAALAKQTHVAPFVAGTKGFGWIGLAQIIGEAGDLSNYANPGKVWRRFGLAPFGGKACSTLRMEKTLTAAEWTVIGYSPRRRSLSFVLGESLMKVSSGPYKAVYDERKAYEIARFAAEGKPVMSAEEAKKKKAKAGEYTPLMVAARRAQRYMEKRLLRDLWRAWRGGEESTDGAGQSPDGAQLSIAGAVPLAD